VPVVAQGHDVCGFFGDTCSPCGFDEGCVGGKCEPTIVFDGGFTSRIGGPCARDLDCGSDGLSFCIPESAGGMPTGWPGGYCSHECDMVPCPTGGVCVSGQASDGGPLVYICVSSCQSGAFCRVGYHCDMNSGFGVCLP
jgi:hypothetical protein